MTLESNSVQAREQLLADALRDSGSATWAVRKSAIDRLATMIDLPPAFKRLVDALNDRDEVIIEAATDALALRAGIPGLQEVARAYFHAEDSGADSIFDRLVEASFARSAPLASQLTKILQSDPPADVREGAEELLKELPVDR